MKHIISIEIEHWKIDCNPGPLTIETIQSPACAENLFNFLDEKFPGKVSLYKDTTEKTMELIHRKKS